MYKGFSAVAAIAAIGCCLAQPAVAAPVTKHRFFIYTLTNEPLTRKEKAIFNKLISDCKRPNMLCLQHAIILSGLPDHIKFSVGYI